MKLGDILFKLSDPDAKLTREERNQLRLLSNEAHDTASYVRGLNNGQSQLKGTLLESPVFLSPPLAPQTLENVGTSVPTATATAITWYDLNYLVSSRSGIFSIDSTDSTKINVSGTGSLGVIGSSSWEPNATGYRRLSLEAYSKNGSLISSNTIYSFLGSITGLAYPIAYFVNNTSIAYFKFIAEQTSGITIDIQSVKATFFLM